MKRATEFWPSRTILQLIHVEHEVTEWRMGTIRDRWRDADDALRAELLEEWRDCAAIQRRLNTAALAFARWGGAGPSGQAAMKPKQADFLLL